MSKNEMREKLQAWREGCLSCRHIRHASNSEPRCAAGNGWEYAHVIEPVLTLSDVARACYWATEGMHLDVSWFPTAASCQPFCPRYERVDA